MCTYQPKDVLFYIGLPRRTPPIWSHLSMQLMVLKDCEPLLLLMLAPWIGWTRPGNGIQQFGLFKVHQLFSDDCLAPLSSNCPLSIPTERISYCECISCRLEKFSEQTRAKVPVETKAPPSNSSSCFFRGHCSWVTGDVFEAAVH